MFSRIEYFAWLREHRAPTFDLGSTDLTIEPPALEPTIAFEDTGAGEDRSLAARLAAEFGVNDDQVLVTAGGTHANFIAVATALTAGDRVLVETPGYEPLVSTPRGLGASVDVFQRPPPDFELRPQRILDNVDADAALVAVTNRHNPSGSQAAVDDLEGIAKQLGAVDARLLIDEVYAPYHTEDRTGLGFADASAAGLPRVIVTGSVSKVFGLRGLRVGWLIADTAFIDRAAVVRDHVSGVADPSVRLAHDVFDTADALIEKAHERVTRNHRLLREFVSARPDLEGPVHPGCPFAFPAHATADGTTVATAAWDAGILVIPGALFGDPQRFRLSAGTAPETISDGFAALGDVLDSL